MEAEASPFPKGEQPVEPQPDKKVKSKAYHQKYYQEHKADYQRRYRDSYKPKGGKRGRPAKNIIDEPITIDEKNIQPIV